MTINLDQVGIMFDLIKKSKLQKSFSLLHLTSYTSCICLVLSLKIPGYIAISDKRIKRFLHKSIPVKALWDSIFQVYIFKTFSFSYNQTTKEKRYWLKIYLEHAFHFSELSNLQKNLLFCEIIR